MTGVSRQLTNRKVMKTDKFIIYSSRCINRLIITISVIMTSLNIYSQSSLSIDSCQAMAVANYPSIARYDMIEKTKKFNLQNANRAYLPQFSIETQASWQSDVTKLELDMPEGFPEIEITEPDKDRYDIAAEVNQLIWDGGKVSSHKKQIDAKARMDTEQLNSEIYAIRKRVNELFFGILLLDERLQQQTILEKELQRNRDNIETYIENGISNQSDLDIVKAEILEAKQQRIELETTREAFIEALSVITGRPIGAGTTFIKPIAPEITKSPEIERPELRFFDAQKDFLRSQQSMLTANNLPTIALFARGGYGKPGLNMFENEFSPYFIGGINLSWNFGNLYSLGNNRRKIELQQQLVDNQRELFLYQLNFEIPQQKIEVEKHKRKMEDDEQIITLRSNIRKAAEVKVQNGIMTVSDLMKEIHQEEAAKRNKVLHEIQFLMSIYNLKFTTN